MMSSLIPALISAAVAFVVLAISQWVIFWRERSRFLLAKLEDLYNLLLQLGERNLRRFEPLVDAFQQEQDQQHKQLEPQYRLTRNSFKQVKEANKLSFDQTYAIDLLERIDLLVNFYFAQLGSDLERVFEANRKCTEILRAGAPPIYGEVREAAAAFGDSSAVIRKRILAERPVLAKMFTGKFQAWFEES